MRKKITTADELKKLLKDRRVILECGARFFMYFRLLSLILTIEFINLNFL